MYWCELDRAAQLRRLLGDEVLQAVGLGGAEDDCRQRQRAIGLLEGVGGGLVLAGVEGLLAGPEQGLGLVLGVGAGGPGDGGDGDGGDEEHDERAHGVLHSRRRGDLGGGRALDVAHRALDVDVDGGVGAAAVGDRDVVEQVAVEVADHGPAVGADRDLRQRRVALAVAVEDDEVVAAARRRARRDQLERRVEVGLDGDRVVAALVGRVDAGRVRHVELAVLVPDHDGRGPRRAAGPHRHQVDEEVGVAVGVEVGETDGVDLHLVIGRGQRDRGRELPAAAAGGRRRRDEDVGLGRDHVGPAVVAGVDSDDGVDGRAGGQLAGGPAGVAVLKLARRHAGDRGVATLEVAVGGAAEQDTRGLVSRPPPRPLAGPLLLTSLASATTSSPAVSSKHPS